MVSISNTISVLFDKIENNSSMLQSDFCFYRTNPALYGVVLGEHIRSVDASMEQVFTVAELIPHPGFATLSFNNDIALVKVRHLLFTPLSRKHGF